MGKNWKNVIAASTKPPGYEICEKAYDYFNCMNDKYDGKYNFIAADWFKDLFRFTW